MRADGQFIIKNNPYDFCCAYIQMIDAMKYFLDRTATNFVSRSDKQLYREFSDNNKTTCEKVVLYITGQSEYPKQLEIPPYRKENVNMDIFQQMAKEHLTCIRNYLSGRDVVI